MMKTKKNEKMQFFLDSFWKVISIFCHLEIHLEALGQRNIDHDYPWANQATTI